MKLTACSSLPAARPDFVEKELKGVMAFQIEVTGLEANNKLSQNRNDEDYWNIITHLENREDEFSHGVAEAMKNQRSPHRLRRDR